MKKRALFATVAIVFLFLSFLYWLHSAGRISIWGVALLIIAGTIFVVASDFFYRRMWSDNDDS